MIGVIRANTRSLDCSSDANKLGFHSDLLHPSEQNHVFSLGVVSSLISCFSSVHNTLSLLPSA